MEKLTHMAPNIDVYIIPDIKQNKWYRKKAFRKRKDSNWMHMFRELGEITLVMALATGVAYIMQRFHLPESNIIMIYILGVLLEERRQIQEFEYGLLIAMLNETGEKLQDSFLKDN